MPDGLTVQLRDFQKTPLSSPHLFISAPFVLKLKALQMEWKSGVQSWAFTFEQLNRTILVLQQFENQVSWEDSTDDEVKYHHSCVHTLMSH